MGIEINWFWLALTILVLAVVALPAVAHFRRCPVSERQSRAPETLARLPSGRTHFRWRGPETGHVVVCVHGLSTPSPVFDLLAEQLVAQGYRVLTYDLYGRGCSDRPLRRYGRRMFVQQLSELLDDQKVSERLTLIGYSMGGAVATMWLADNPRRVERLILLAPAGLGHLLAPFQTWCANTPILGAWAWALFGGMALRRGTERPPQFPQLADLVAEDSHTRGTLRAIRSSHRNVLAEFLGQEHRSIARAGYPVLAIWGREDDVIPLSSLGRLTESNRAARQEVIETADHGLPYTHPEDVAAIIQSWISESQG